MSRKRSRENDDVVDEEARAKRARVENLMGNAGQITRLHLENFMCHSNLKVELKPGVNIITGDNGSGKSAILASLQIALGGQAKVTSRGSSLKDVIKEGKDKCRVTIHISNKGFDAYQPDVYGEEIVVVRSITKSSTSFQIRNDAGEVVSKSLHDVKPMLSHFNIFLDNPCTIMKQDVSKRFLRSSPEEKYKFFLEATQLQATMNYYDKAYKAQKIFAQEIEKKESALVEYERKEAMCRKELEDAKDLEELDNQIEELGVQFVWAKIMEEETKLNQFEAKLEENKQHLQQINQKMQEKTDSIQETQENVAKLSAKSSEKTGQFQASERQLSTLKTELNQIMEKKRAQNSSINSFQSEIDMRKTRIQRHQKDIEEQKKEMNRDRSGEMAKYQAKLDDLDARIQQQQAIVNENAEERNKMSTDLPQREQDYHDANSEYKYVEQQLRQLDSDIRRIRGSRNNPLNSFNPAIINLIKLIASNIRSFKQCPIGPVGLLIRVNDLRYGAVAEHILRQHINSFIVVNKQDHDTLHRLARRANLNRISVIITRFHNAVYSDALLQRGGVPSDQYLCLRNLIAPATKNIPLSGLPLDTNTYFPTIMNALIDHAYAATTIIAHTDDHARQIMFSGSRPPQHVSQCFSLNGSRFIKRGNTAATDPVKDIRSSLWFEDMEEHLKNQERKREELVNDMQGKKEAVREKERIYRELKQKIDKLLHAESRAMSELTKLKSQKQRLENDPPPEENMDAIQDAIEQSKSRIQSETEKIASLEEKIEEFRSKDEDYEKQKELQEEIRKIQQERSTLKSELEDIVKDLQIQERRISTLRVQVVNELAKEKVAAEKAVELFEATVQSKKNALEANIVQANEVHERVEVSLSSDTLQKRRNALLTKKQAEMRRFGNRDLDAIRRAYAIALNEYEGYKDSYDQSKKNCDDCYRSLNARFEKWKKLREETIRAVRREFQDQVKNKENFIGTLDVDIENSTLETKIEVGGQTRSVASLSGGEGTFVTTCFLIALWRMVESPFRFLDEIDVFMDPTVRKKTMDMLIERAFSDTTSQLVIITPQQMSQLKIQEVNLIRLNPPDRHGMMQTRLSDYQ